MAANRQGASDLLALVERYSLAGRQAYMDTFKTRPSKRCGRRSHDLPAGTHTIHRSLEADGTCRSPSQFTIHDAGHNPAATIDFTGTGPVVAGNLNANRAIVTAAVMYVLRLLIDEDIPLNHGVLRRSRSCCPSACSIRRPGKTPETTPAVVGGNVETSQRVVDVLLGALGLAAASQGTMNNLLFGDATFGYYETICGGSGATADAPGATPSTRT